MHKLNKALTARRAKSCIQEIELTLWMREKRIKQKTATVCAFHRDYAIAFFDVSQGRIFAKIFFGNLVVKIFHFCVCNVCNPRTTILAIDPHAATGRFRKHLCATAFFAFVFHLYHSPFALRLNLVSLTIHISPKR